MLINIEFLLTFVNPPPKKKKIVQTAFNFRGGPVGGRVQRFSCLLVVQKAVLVLLKVHSNLSFHGTF